nr:LPXTG cell wall anchor domain-containing protein [Lentilactobacillus dabitei]
MPKPAASDLPNEQAAELPQTGDQTSILAVILGISLLIVISGWLVLRRKSCD